ncbi:MAG: hypothetical protein M1834_004266 [Cirrosporium novae-zelandiae]|nr:MAG: hypothetical protein M1834_004266 [Cirrosporium novae-zelandiae]
MCPPPYSNYQTRTPYISFTSIPPQQPITTPSETSPPSSQPATMSSSTFQSNTTTTDAFTYILSNLANAKATFGENSPQYREMSAIANELLGGSVSREIGLAVATRAFTLRNGGNGGETGLEKAIEQFRVGGGNKDMEIGANTSTNKDVVKENGGVGNTGNSFGATLAFRPKK